MYTPEELERIYKEAMKNLTTEEKMAVGVIIKKIGQLSMTSIAIGELLRLKCPGLFEEGIEVGELDEEVKKLIEEYNITSDQEATLIGMLPNQAMRDTFGTPPKINL